MSSNSSFVAPAKSSNNIAILPIVHYPICTSKLIQLVSKTDRNPGRIFYKCPNYQQKQPCTCTFFMWEEVYEVFLEDIGIITRRSGGRHDKTGGTQIEAVLDEVTDKLQKNGNSRFGESIEMIKICAFMNSGVLIIMFTIMIIMLVVMLLK